MRLLEGAVVQKVRLAANALVAQVRAPGRTRWIVVAADAKGRALLGLTDRRPVVGSTEGVSEGERVRARKLLDGARVERIDERSVTFTKLEERLRVGVANGRVAVATVTTAMTAAVDDGAGEGAGEEDEASWIERGRSLAETIAEGARGEAKRELERAIDKAVARIERRASAVRGDLAKMVEAQRLATLATSFVAEASRAPRGARELKVVDWSTGEAKEIAIALDPAKPARAQLDAKFARAKRMKQGAIIANARLAEAESAARALVELRASLANEDVDLLATRARAKAIAGKDFALGGGGSGARKKDEEPRRPYRRFLGANDAPILVGRGGADNDALSFHVGKPTDRWLHAKNQKGAHVIVPLDKNKTCPSELLVDAAHLAAHFSDAREEAVVEVEHTERRHLRKPKGAAPGFVVVQREKVLVLRVDRDRLARLLAREEA